MALLFFILLIPLICDVIPANASRHSFHRDVIRVLVFEYPPFTAVTRGPNNTFQMKGIIFDYMDFIAKRINLTVVYIPEDQEAASKFGQVQAAFGMLINDVVDVLGTGFVVSSERMKILDFTQSVFHDTFIIWSEKPMDETRLFAFIRPFRWEVWCLTGASFIITIFVLSWGSWFILHKLSIDKSKETRFSCYLSQYTFYNLSTLTNQGGILPTARFQIRLATVFWLLAATVLVNSYAGILTSSLTFTKQMKAIDSLDDFAEASNVGLTIPVGMVLYYEILNATSGPYRKLGDKLRADPKAAVPYYKDMVPVMRRGGYAAIYPKSIVSNFLADIYRETKHCSFYMSSTIFGSYTGWPLQKKSRFTEALSESMISIWDIGIVNRWARDLLNDGPSGCFGKADESQLKQKPLKLVDLSSSFLILAIGLGVSLFCFTFEVITFKCKQRSSKI